MPACVKCGRMLWHGCKHCPDCGADQSPPHLHDWEMGDGFWWNCACGESTQRPISKEEQQWNLDHGLTANCPVCGNAMREGQEVCTWRCWYTRKAEDQE